jgi:hypothetical protein
MIVHGHRERFLGVFLADDVLIEKVLNFPRRCDLCEGRNPGAGEFALLLANDVVGQIDAVGADVDVAGTLDHRADVSGAFAAERTGRYATSAKTAGGKIATVGWGHISAAIAGAISI